jgi:hypothetical protein
MVSTISSERKNHMSLTLNQKLSIINLSEEGIPKARTGWKLCFLCQKDNLWMQKISSSKKSKVLLQRTHEWQKSKTAFSGLNRRSDHSLDLSQNLIQSKALNLFNSKGWESEEATEENFDATRSWLIRFKYIQHFHNIKVQDESMTSTKKNLQ